MNEFSRPTLARLEERLRGIASPHRFSVLDAEGFEGLRQQSGLALVFFAEDPLKVPETWDVAVILADALKRLPMPVHLALLTPEAGRTLAGRQGVNLWPALVGLRDGGYLGCLEGMMDWSVFSRRLEELLAAPVSRPPGIGIPVQAAATCH